MACVHCNAVVTGCVLSILPQEVDMYIVYNGTRGRDLYYFYRILLCMERSTLQYL